MISIKSPREIELMAEAGAIVARVHKKMAEIIKPGISTLEINRIAEQVIRENGATPSFKNYQGFPAAVCTSVNDMLVHGIPDHTILKDGDIITVDVGACYKGYHGDSGWTYAVGNVDEKVLKLMEVTKESLFLGLAQVKPGAGRLHRTWHWQKCSRRSLCTKCRKSWYDGSAQKGHVHRSGTDGIYGFGKMLYLAGRLGCQEL